MRTVRIPRILHELHGEESTVFDLVITYTVTFIAAALVVLRPSARPVATRWWEIALVAIVAADLAGGVVATFTRGTDRYYSERPRVRLVFIGLHVIQPIVLALVIGGPTAAWVVLPAYTILSAFVVNAIRGPAQLTVGAALTGVGIFVCFSFLTIAPPAFWFAPVFMVKLILGFSVRRTENAAAQ